MAESKPNPNPPAKDLKAAVTASAAGAPPVQASAPPPAAGLVELAPEARAAAEAQAKADAAAQPTAEAPPSGWWHARLAGLPDRLGVHVQGEDKPAAVRAFCGRMGVLVEPEEGPRTTDRIIATRCDRPDAKDLRGKYTRDELVALGYTAGELDAAGV